MEFDKDAGAFVHNLLHSLQEEAERLPSPMVMLDSFKNLDPTADQIGAFVGKCVEKATKVQPKLRRDFGEQAQFSQIRRQTSMLPMI